MALARPPVTDVWANTVAPGPSDLFDIPTYIDSGFPAPGGVPVVPPLGFFNWLLWFMMLGIRYLLSRAFTPWDSTETQYVAGSMVQDSDGRFYVCRGGATTGSHPSSDINWLSLNMLDRVPDGTSGGDFTSKISRWLTPRARAVFCLDRWGLPQGNYYQYREMWGLQINWGAFSPPSGSFGLWAIVGAGTNTRVSNHAPGITANQNALNTAPSLELIIDRTSASNKIAIYSFTLGSMSADALMIAHFQSAFVNDVIKNNYVMGLVATSDPIDSIGNGAYFLADAGTSNWICVSVNGGTSTQSATSVPVVAGNSGAHDFDVVLVGSGIGDGTTARALFYIDGALVNNITANVPNSSGSPVNGSQVAGGWVVATGGSADKSLVLGPATYTQIVGIPTP